MLLVSLSLGLLGRVANAQAGDWPSLFEMAEAQVEPMPNEPRQLDLAPGDGILDLAASPTGPEVAILVRPRGAPARLMLWNLASRRTEAIWNAAGEFAAHWLAWHPTGQALFVLGTGGGESALMRLDRTSAGWKAATIFRSKKALQRLMAGPRPFTTGLEKPSPFYRLFFGAGRPGGTSLIASVGEHGEEDQAIVARNIYRLWFSHPSVGGIDWWNLVDGTGLNADNQPPQQRTGPWFQAKEMNENIVQGGLVRADFTLKPAFTVLENLVRKEWWTNIRQNSGPNAELRVQGFYGDYKLTATHAGKTVERKIHLTKNGMNDFEVAFP